MKRIDPNELRSNIISLKSVDGYKISVNKPLTFGPALYVRFDTSPFMRDSVHVIIKNRNLIFSDGISYTELRRL